MDVVDGISKLFTVLHFWSFSFFWKCYSFKGRLWYYLSCLMQYQKMSKVSNYKRTLFHNKQEVIGHEEYSMQISIGGINKNDCVLGELRKITFSRSEYSVSLYRISFNKNFFLTEIFNNAVRLHCLVCFWKREIFYACI